MTTPTARNFLALSLAVVLLAAGGYALWKYFAAVGPAAERTDMQPVSGDMVVIDCKGRLFDESPAIAVAFSHPLERKQAFDKLLSVTDHGPSRPERTEDKPAPRKIVRCTQLQNR